MKSPGTVDVDVDVDVDVEVDADVVVVAVVVVVVLAAAAVVRSGHVNSGIRSLVHTPESRLLTVCAGDCADLCRGCATGCQWQLQLHLHTITITITALATLGSRSPGASGGEALSKPTLIHTKLM